MTQWLFDTLLWTAALIAIVLVIRRPVARWFGPQIAYALWAIPAIRLILPSITLPAWMAPIEPSAANTNQSQSPFPLSGSDAPVATQMGAPETFPEAETAASDLAMPNTLPSFFDAAPWAEIGCAVWLIGAATFLWCRFSSYFELRRELLDNAREVGRSGRIRLMETSATNAPLAFGVISPVIALPEGFMAQQDRTARDLALEHEFSHHKAHDLLINVLVQPLFALHWFNPLSYYGWMALRRDQEAACDARVMAYKPTQDRSVYAKIIANTAAGQNFAPSFALAAPMACPVLGDKSIIHRLRSLNMSDTSFRRRMAGRFMIAAAVLALPLTVSISYAESVAAEAYEAPTVPKPLMPPTPPVAPEAPAFQADAPSLPVPPAPLSPGAVQSIAEIDPDTEIGVVETDGTRAVRIKKLERKDDGKTKTINRTVSLVNTGDKWTDEERKAVMDELRAELSELEKELEETSDEIRRTLIEIDIDEFDSGNVVISMDCLSDTDDVATVEEKDGEVRKIFICQDRVLDHALKGLEDARKAIAGSTKLQKKMRSDIVKNLDRQIERLKQSQS